MHSNHQQQGALLATKNSNKNKKAGQAEQQGIMSWKSRAGYSAQSTKHTNSYVESSTNSEVLATFSNRLSAQNPGRLFSFPGSN
jgi:hypothetical protein